MFTLKNFLILIGKNALISLVVVFISITGIIFLSKEIGRISDSVALNHRLEKELIKRTTFLESLKNDIQIVGANDIKIDNAFVPSDNISGFVNALDGLATKIGVSQVYHFETPVPSAISSTLPILTISYSNSFGTNVLTFSNYLKELNKLPYYTKIDGFTISSQDKNGWLGNSTVSFRATLYTKATQ